MAYLAPEMVRIEVKCSCGAYGARIATRPEAARFAKSFSPAHDPHEISAKLERTAKDGDLYYHEECRPSDATVVVKHLNESELDAVLAANDEVICDFCGEEITDDDD